MRPEPRRTRLRTSRGCPSGLRKRALGLREGAPRPPAAEARALLSGSRVPQDAPGIPARGCGGRAGGACALCLAGPLVTSPPCPGWMCHVPVSAPRRPEDPPDELQGRVPGEWGLRAPFASREQAGGGSPSAPSGSTSCQVNGALPSAASPSPPALGQPLALCVFKDFF